MRTLTVVEDTSFSFVLDCVHISTISVCRNIKVQTIVYLDYLAARGDGTPCKRALATFGKRFGLELYRQRRATQKVMAKSRAAIDGD